MKTNHKILIDKMLGKIFLGMMRLWTKKDDSKTADNFSPKKILVCKFLGMGSIIQSTSLLLTLKKNFPKAEIVFLSSKTNKELLEMIPSVDSSFLIDDSSIFAIIRETFRVFSYLKKEKTDLYFDLEPHSFYSKILCKISGAKIRNGFHKEGEQEHSGLYTNEIAYNSGVSLQDSYLKMAAMRGCKQIVNELYDFPGSKTTPGRAYVVVNVNASDLRIERRWPAENYVALLSTLANDYPEIDFILTGSKTEAAYVHNIYSKIAAGKNSNIVNLAGKQTLAELFALIRNSKMMITNDTGPMHIGFALRRPVLALFGPASPLQYHCPPESTGIYRKIACSPCVHHAVAPPCHGNNECMKQISVEEVASHFKKMIDEAIK